LIGVGAAVGSRLMLSLDLLSVLLHYFFLDFYC